MWQDHFGGDTDPCPSNQHCSPKALNSKLHQLSLAGCNPKTRGLGLGRRTHRFEAGFYTSQKYKATLQGGLYLSQRVGPRLFQNEFLPHFLKDQLNQLNGLGDSGSPRLAEGLPDLDGAGFDADELNEAWHLPGVE